jgi:hypothetical protein
MISFYIIYHKLLLAEHNFVHSWLYFDYLEEEEAVDKTFKS